MPGQQFKFLAFMMSGIRKKRRPATVKLNLVSSKASKLEITRVSVPLVTSRTKTQATECLLIAGLKIVMKNSQLEMTVKMTSPW